MRPVDRPSATPVPDDREWLPGNQGQPVPRSTRRLDIDESMVDLRCSLVLVDDDHVLVIHRTGRDRDDWVLPGGRPRTGESLAACISRETREETGLEVTPTRIAFVGEVIDPHSHERTVEVVFLGSLLGRAGDRLPRGERGATPQWMGRERLRQIDLRPPIAGYLPAVMHRSRSDAAYLGNMWRPRAAGSA